MYLFVVEPSSLNFDSNPRCCVAKYVNQACIKYHLSLLELTQTDNTQTFSYFSINTSWDIYNDPTECASFIIFALSTSICPQRCATCIHKVICPEYISHIQLPVGSFVRILKRRFDFSLDGGSIYLTWSVSFLWRYAPNGNDGIDNSC